MSSDPKVDDLKAQVADLTARIEKLEAGKAAGSDSQKPAEAMRMILIGPPGAGSCPRQVYSFIR